MKIDLQWGESIARDVEFGFLGRSVIAPKRHHPQVILNGESSSVLRVLREELRRCTSFTFSVAFVSPRALALIKQELVEFEGVGRIITSDYLAFNSPASFAELQNLQRLGIDVRIHRADAFHPKGYIFEHADSVTAMIGSANLTANALVRNHEWNLKVSATPESDLAAQLADLVDEQVRNSGPLTEQWINDYASNYLAPAPLPREPLGRNSDDDVRPPIAPLVAPPGATEPPSNQSGLTTKSKAARGAATRTHAVVPNKMQRDALLAIDLMRSGGARRAIVISATGTGKTILSALDVREFNPRRMLFIVHREQILDRTIEEYQRVLESPPEDFGKLTGSIKQPDARFLFATVQTLSQPEVLEQFAPDEFDYLLIDEAHRAGAATYRRVLDHFDPQFTLGMTATPERTDGFNVFELFHYNVPYEIRLNHALEEDMLAPFHYYGVADVTYEDGSTTSEVTDPKLLVAPERIDHLLRAIEVYGHAGVPPRGLIFCGRKDEARSISAALNQRDLRGHRLRTVALTGDDSVAEREEAVRRLEQGALDYILTVDVFNEGVDIPSVNQVIMLRQTQSAIVFVQQLGRGLRKSPGKEYVVVIDVIGNYATNFLIPIALFGDESLNKESLRKNLIASEESGVLPGLSSVRFDRVAQERVLRAITKTTLDTMQRLKGAIIAMRNRVGDVPLLWDFLRFESVDPTLLATKREHYPALVTAVLQLPSNLSELESRALSLLSHEVLPAKRLHEFVTLRVLLTRGAVALDELADRFRKEGLPATDSIVQSAVDTFTLAEHADADRRRYHAPLATLSPPGVLTLEPAVAAAYAAEGAFARQVDDLIRTGEELTRARYILNEPFTAGMQYSRKDTTRLLGWPRKWASTLYGYKTELSTGACPIFVTLHKSGDISASTAYEDELLDRSNLLWYTRSRRTLQSNEVRAIVEGKVAVYVFVKKDDAEGSDFYFLGRASAHDAEQTSMPADNGQRLPVVRMRLHFDAPIPASLFDYFHPTVTVEG